MDKTKPVQRLSWILFLSMFLTGFESGGYQACLLSIGTSFHLNESLMGLLSAIQLAAILIAPLVFGTVDRRIGKKIAIQAFLVCRIIGCLLVLLAQDAVVFAIGIFIVGLSIAMVQSLSIAGLSDAYPSSGKKKIGLMTSMYSLGAVIAPLLMGALIDAGYSWRLLFLIVILLSTFMIVTLARESLQPKEQALTKQEEHTGLWTLPIILMLCLIMFIYVGVENGFGFFMNSFVKVTLKGSHAYLALSMFWLAMIPSRMLVGSLMSHREIVLPGACLGVGLSAFALALTTSASMAIIICFPLGFFAGAIYPCCLGYCVDYAGSSSARATAMITASTGLGGTLIAGSFGYMSQYGGMRFAFLCLGALMIIDLLVAFILIGKTRKERGIS